MSAAQPEPEPEAGSKRKSTSGGGSSKKKKKGEAGDAAAEMAEAQEKMKGDRNLVQQPTGMTGGTLKPYQVEGLRWLATLFENGLSGILADEMGLGKTLQSIGLLAWLREAKGLEGPFLVLAPKSTLTNWQREFEMWCPALRVLKYHGSEAERAAMRGDILGGGFHVVLCTFKLWEQDSDKAKAERSLFKKLQLSYLVLDEAQQIKNSESRRYKNLTAVRSAHRLLLTGTPIENSPRELLSLLAFLMPSTFASTSGALARRTRARTRTRTRTPGPEPNRPTPDPIPTAGPSPSLPPTQARTGRRA